MKTAQSIFSFLSGVHPDALAINSTGAGTQDGTEYIAEGINNFWLGPTQALMDYASLTPDGVTEAAGASQILEAIQLGHGIGPGIYKQWGKFDDPSVTGDRVLLLSNQGVLIASFLDLVAATYVGDGNNATAPYFYKAELADGVTRNVAGPFFILPPANPTYKRQYLGDGTDFTVTGSGWTTTRAVAVPYQTSDGTRRLSFNIRGAVSSSTRTSYTATMSGVVFKNVATYNQAITAHTGSSTTSNFQKFVILNTGDIQINHASATTTSYFFSGDVELESKPTWADDFEFPWGITY